MRRRCVRRSLIFLVQVEDASQTLEGQVLVDRLDVATVRHDGRGETTGCDYRRFPAHLGNESLHDPIDETGMTVESPTLDRLDRPLPDRGPGRHELDTAQCRRS